MIVQSGQFDTASRKATPASSSQMNALTGLVRKQEAQRRRDKATGVQGDIRAIRNGADALPDAEADEFERQRAEAEAERLRRVSGAPQIHLGRLAELRRHEPWTEALDAVAGILRVFTAGATVAVIGDYGTGKTQLGVCCIDWFSRQHLSSKYMRAGEFFRAIDDARNCSQSQDEIVKRYSKADLLVVDELDKPQETVSRGAILAELIDIRYSGGKHTILLGNYTREGFESSVDKSILSRVDEHGDIVTLEGWNFRKEMPCE